MHDIRDSKELFAGCIFGAFILGMIWMLFMGKCACILVWLCILLYMSGIGCIAYFSHMKGNEYKERDDAGGEGANWTQDE